MSKKNEQSDYHLNRIKAIQNSHDENGFKKEVGNLMARVFIRATGAIRKGKNYIINEDDLMSWFENGDYLSQKTEWDAI